MALNEAETRAEHIDPALAAAGWGKVEGSRIRREYVIAPGRIASKGEKRKVLKADYVLEYRDRRMAVIEAKAWDEELTEGVVQAKIYAQKLSIRHTYATNGQGIYAIDMETGAEGEAAAWPTPDELWDAVFPPLPPRAADALPASDSALWRERFSAIPFPDKSGSWEIRFYQQTAVERVLDAIGAGRNRILLTLATGTGKTSIAFQIAWKLFQAKWNLSDWHSAAEPARRPRILFLADRNNLADQAFNDFTSFVGTFEEEALARISPDAIRKKGKVPKNGSVFFTIFQTFMSGKDAEGRNAPYFGEYPPDFFDFIIIDECHRGGANDESTWRDILNYFSPAVQLGLTATPRRVENKDTYLYFGEPVYIYSLKDGINDGFLTPFRVKRVQTTLDEYIFTPDDHVIEGEIEEGRTYQEQDFNKVIEIKEREKKRVELFMSMIDQREKTLVFCATQTHALVVRDLINQTKTSTNPDYCHRVTADDGEIGNGHLRDFQNNDNTIPTILTTSQKLTTGVDARNVRNIVLMRPIDSIVEFKQIIGRGTRLYDGKDYFTLYDFVDAHKHFRDPEWDGEPEEPEACEKCGQYPCVCEEQPPKVCPVCNQRPCICEKEQEGPCEKCGQEPCVCHHRHKVKVKLADGKERTIQHMVQTSFWDASGRPISAQQFLERLYGELPAFFKDEDDLRRQWGQPDTRKLLLHGLAEKGFPRDQLLEMQKLIDAEKSDLFDVLAYVAYNSAPVTREERAAHAKIAIGAAHFTDKQQAFLDFVLGHYVTDGVDELDREKLTPLLRLKYGATDDAIKNLGSPAEINSLFVSFQPWLYHQAI